MVSAFNVKKGKCQKGFQSDSVSENLFLFISALNRMAFTFVNFLIVNRIVSFVWKILLADVDKKPTIISCPKACQQPSYYNIVQCGYLDYPVHCISSVQSQHNLYIHSPAKEERMIPATTTS